MSTTKMAASEAIAEKVKEICKTLENTNQIQDLLVQLENGSPKDVKESMEVLYGVFCYHLKVGTWLKKVVSQEDEKAIAKDIVSTWLSSSFTAYLELLTQKVKDDLSPIQCKAMETFLQIVNVEYQTGKSQVKPSTRFAMLLRQLLTSNMSDKLLTLLDEYLQHLDIQCYLLKKLSSFFEIKDFKIDENVAENTFKILHIVTSNLIEVEDAEISLYLPHQSDKKLRKSYKKVFTSSWLAFLRINMSSVLRKKVLIDLDTKVMPHLEDPRVLIDFLTDCYNSGGVTSLLALNSLFILINDHNLDYPDFYTNLYKIIDPSIFQMKYKSRFFFSIDMFLSSTYLPAYVIAAFVKKFSRMLLYAPAPDILMVLVLIKNLLIRHPSSRVLIHRKQGSKMLQGDPYKYDEINLSQCGAMESCLWEVDSLFSHYSSEVKRYVASFKKDIPKNESDLAVYFDKTYEEMFHVKMEKSANLEKEVPVNFVKSEVFEQLDTEMWVF